LTERRIPATLQPSDLGESFVQEDARWPVVSFISSPLVIGRDNVYVVFVLDDTLASRTSTYEWSFELDDEPPESRRTEVGEITYRPKATGTLRVTVRLLDAGNTEQATIALSQDVVDPNAELEALIEAARNQPGPGVGNPQVARELVNDHNLYYQGVALRTPETGDSFRLMIFGMVSDGAQQRTAARRTEHLHRLAAALNGKGDDFATLAIEGELDSVHPGARARRQSRSAAAACLVAAAARRRRRSAGRGAAADLAPPAGPRSHPARALLLARGGGAACGGPRQPALSAYAMA
jgi:hypothetical protein